VLLDRRAHAACKLHDLTTGTQSNAGEDLMLKRERVDVAGGSV
jgi:hypothetical protein